MVKVQSNSFSWVGFLKNIPRKGIIRVLDLCTHAKKKQQKKQQQKKRLKFQGFTPEEGVTYPSRTAI